MNRMKSFPIRILLLLGLFLFSCSQPQPESGTLTQVSTIDALLAGMYDGQMSCKELSTQGGFGIGTFDRLDGEMVVYEGVIYQVKADGEIVKAAPEMTTPFATVMNFITESSSAIDTSMNVQDIQNFLDRAISNPNLFYGIQIHGEFAYMKTRSVPAQEKPYPPLVEVTAKQSVFESANISGTIVGLYCPPFVKGINLPGYHLHFLSDDRQHGGHILDFRIEQGTVSLSSCNRFVLDLPAEGDFHRIDLSKDRSDELKQAEE